MSLKGCTSCVEQLCVCRREGGLISFNSFNGGKGQDVNTGQEMEESIEIRTVPSTRSEGRYSWSVLNVEDWTLPEALLLLPHVSLLL